MIMKSHHERVGNCEELKRSGNHSTPSNITKKTFIMCKNENFAIKEVFKLNQKISNLLTEATISPKQYRNTLLRQKEYLELQIERCTRYGVVADKYHYELLYVQNELEVMEVELKEELIYLPDGQERKISSITDIIYYEALYGKYIYQRP